MPLAAWQPFEQRLADRLSELSDGVIDRDETFRFEAAHVNAMIAVVEAEAVPPRPSCVTGSHRLRTSHVAPPIVTWVSSSSFLERLDPLASG